MADPILTALLRRGSRRRRLDPAAVLAVASVEGGLRRGAIGDQGTSAGPFQLHRGGALPRGRNLAWASSDAGINYALDQIARVAAGKRGRAAIAAIVSRFERPAAVGAEIEKAFGRYGNVGGGGALLSPPAARPASGQAALAAPVDLTSIFNIGREAVGLDPSPVVTPTMPALPPRRAYTRQPKPGVRAGDTYKAKRGRTVPFLEAFTQPFGVTVTSTTSGNHVKNSYHYKGRAIDVGGSPARLAAAMRAALQHPGDFSEAFFTGPGNPGMYIKDGKVYPNSQLDPSVRNGHHDHLHLAR